MHLPVTRLNKSLRPEDYSACPGICAYDHELHEAPPGCGEKVFVCGGECFPLFRAGDLPQKGRNTRGDEYMERGWS